MFTFRVDANDLLSASTLKVDADNRLLASTLVDANTLIEKKNTKQIKVEEY